MQLSQYGKNKGTMLLEVVPPEKDVEKIRSLDGTDCLAE